MNLNNAVFLALISSLISGLIVFVIQFFIEQRRKSRQYENTLSLLFYEIHKIILAYQPIFQEVNEVHDDDWLRSQRIPGMTPQIYFVPQTIELLVYKGFEFSSLVMDFYIYTDSIKSKLENYSRNLNEKILLQASEPKNPRVKELEELVIELTKGIQNDFNIFNTISSSMQELKEYQEIITNKNTKQKWWSISIRKCIFKQG